MTDATVIFGDCREVMRGMAEGSVDAIVTDPPYGVDYDRGGQPDGPRVRSSVKVDWAQIAGDKRPEGEWLSDAYRILKEGGALYACTRWDVEPEWRSMLLTAGFRVQQRLTWHKRVSGIGDTAGTYAPTCEDVLFATKGRHLLNRRPPMLLDVGCVPTWERRYHPHQKPVALPKLLIETSTAPGDLVFEPFAGSGSTVVACQKTGRRCIGVELDPRYIPIIRRRVSEARTPLLDGVG